MQLGVRAHDFGKLPPRQLAETVAGHGFTAVQLALPKAIEGINSYRDITDRRLYEIKDAFAACKVDIAVLGCYIEPVMPSAALRREQAELFMRGIYCAAMLNAGCVATETSWFDEPETERPQALGFLYEALETWLAQAAKDGVTVGIEPVRRHTLHTPGETADLLRRFANAPLAVVFDPMNLLAPEKVPAQQALWAECLNAFGGHVAALHVKDAQLAGSAFAACPLGAGVMQYHPAITAWLADANTAIPLLREGLDLNRIPEETAWMRETFGVAYGCLPI